MRCEGRGPPAKASGTFNASPIRHTHAMPILSSSTMIVDSYPPAARLILVASPSPSRGASARAKSRGGCSRLIEVISTATRDRCSKARNMVGVATFEAYGQPLPPAPPARWQEATACRWAKATQRGKAVVEPGIHVSSVEPIRAHRRPVHHSTLR